MSKSKHTPGPWWVEVHNKVTTIESRNYTITNDVGNDNCDLIAAAPEILAALKALLEDVRGINGWQGWDSGALAEAAIAKAEGRS